MGFAAYRKVTPFQGSILTGFNMFGEFSKVDSCALSKHCPFGRKEASNEVMAGRLGNTVTGAKNPRLLA